MPSRWHSENTSFEVFCRDSHAWPQHSASTQGAPFTKVQPRPTSNNATMIDCWSASPRVAKFRLVMKKTDQVLRVK